MSRTVLVTGASSGIGRATVEVFKAKGWDVAATARKPESLRDLELPGRVEAFRLDVDDPASIREGVAAALGRFGTIDALVNNAGFAVLGAFETLTPEQARHQFATNVFGLMETTRVLLPHFRERRGGTIVNVSSIGGRMAFPMLSLYHASKWAVEGFSESLRFEVESFGIRVKLIEPGVIKTDFYGRSMDRSAGVETNPYEELRKKVVPRMDEAGKKGTSPDEVARVIYRAATDGRSRLRYSAHGQPFLALRKLLPEATFFALIRMAMMR
jgi:NAD(P)-dependent dehydrogenase (short-subunit alcohol dehydrogenase family)